MRRRSLLTRIFKISGITIGSLLILLFVLPYLFPDAVANKVKGWVNRAVTTKVDFSKARFSFFDHFPSLTFTLTDISITGSAPFDQDTLIVGKELSFGVDLLSLFSNSIKINKIFLSDANIGVQVDSLGRANYNIYRSTNNSVDTSASQTGLQLESIVIENTNLVYNDRSVPITISAQHLNYKGTGDLSKAVFDLTTRLSADSFSLVYAGEHYVNKKKLRAKLITAINTQSLSLIFEDNRIMINQLPVRFSGNFDILPHGYNMDLTLASRRATLEKMLSAVPPDMATWMDDTKLKGDVVFGMELKGIYDRSAGSMPDFMLNFNLHNGFVAYKKAPIPLEKLVVKMNAHLPAMNMDSLMIRIDTLQFSVGKGHFNLRSYSMGLHHPFIETAIKADLDLDVWNKALGFDKVALKGLLKLDFNAKGQYATGQNPHSWRADTVITSIPAFALSSTLRDGYFKFVSLPEPVSEISFDITSSCPDDDYRHIRFDASNLRFAALNNTFGGFIKIKDPETPDINAAISGKFNLDDIEKFIPLEKLKLSGEVAADAKISGVYDKQKNVFPITDIKLSVSDGSILTGYYPDPVTHIRVLTEIRNTDGKLSGTAVSISPINFEFEGQPFMLQADLSDPDDLSYQIVSKGVINIGKLYRVFGIKRYDVDGFVKTDLSLKGRQSDAMAGRIQKLDNSGILQVRNIRLRSELLPDPLIISKGDFRFRQDKMWLDDFRSSYGTDAFVLNGYLENVVGYALGNNTVLKGQLNLTSDKIDLNQFTAFKRPDDDISGAGTDSSGTGVILVPKDMSLAFTANVGKAVYDSVLIEHFKGTLMVDSGKIKLLRTNFLLAGAVFDLSADYEDVSPHKALFDFKIHADSFSIAKAYQEIPMFREMVSSASGVQGIVGMDYSLSGRLDQNMQPVYPSLAGGGVINLKKVKLKGFKLMNAVGKSTGRSDLNDPDLSGIDLKTTVKNNIITLERTRLRILGFRPRFEGQVSLDGQLNIKGRLGLPPLGIIGIPFTVSGTSEDPVVRLKKDKSGKLLQETEDTDEEAEPLPSSEHQQPE